MIATKTTNAAKLQTMTGISIPRLTTLVCAAALLIALILCPGSAQRSAPTDALTV
jgi:hypothetical protein